MVERHVKKGFTIIELLIVIVVIAILAAIVLIAYNGIRHRATEASLKSDLRNATNSLQATAATDTKYPSSQESANGGKGLPKSNGTTYQYSYDAATNSYCVTATNSSLNGVSYFSSSTDLSVRSGACPGHSAVGFEQPSSCPAGYIPVPGNATFNTQGGFCVMKYESKATGNTAISQAAGQPITEVSLETTVSIIAASEHQSAYPGTKVMTRNERLTLAHNVLNVPSNWSGGSVGSGYIYSGHNDGNPNTTLAASTNDADGYFGTNNTSGNQRRTLTLSNGSVIWDFAGNASEFTQETVGANQQPGTPADSAYACREYNQSDLQFRSLSLLKPSYGTGAAATWTGASNGVGQICSQYNETATRAMRWGGPFNSTVTAGLFALGFFNSPTDAVADTGFRLTK